MSFDKDTQQNIEMIIKMLDGTFSPEKDVKKRKGLPSPDEMKNYL